MLLAVIPARGGSKGIPRKNLALLNGKPLIEYTIAAAKASPQIDEILLSTDDEEIATVAVRLGLEARYRRPSELAADATPMIDTVEHAVHWFATDRGVMPEEIILLQPTSPLRRAEDISGAVRSFRESGAPSLVSVHPMAEHPYECIEMHDRGWNYLVKPPDQATRRQNYQHRYYFINGAIYLAKTRSLLSSRGFIDAAKTETFVMPRERGLDIDTFTDLKTAEAFLKDE